VTAVPVTGTVGPRYTHIALGAEAGLTEYAGGYANVTDLHIIHKPTLRNRLGHVADAEMASLGWAVRHPDRNQLTPARTLRGVVEQRDGSLPAAAPDSQADGAWRWLAAGVLGARGGRGLP